MTDLPRAAKEKIINPEFARGALHSDHPHGEFKALVKLLVPEQLPQYMQYIEVEAPGLFWVHIPCDKMANLQDDDNIISVELIERISSCSKLS